MSLKFKSLIFFALILSISGCNSAPTSRTESVDTVQTNQEQQSPQEIADLSPDTKGPWDGVMYSAKSTDGLTFTDETLVLERAGVANLLKLQNGDLVLTYQYFSETDEDLFDAICYSISKDGGDTWSEITAIKYENLPSPLDVKFVPMDPTLVQLDDGRLRLYFTYHAKGNKKPALYSATTVDEDITSDFVVNATPALMADAFLLDPAVTFFSGKWHHFTWQDGSDNNYHSVSDDGLTFTMQDEISLPMEFLGQVIPYEKGLRFYGTGKGGVLSAVSTDGYTWTQESGTRLQGADPAVQKLDDGTYIMVYTNLNFNN